MTGESQLVMAAGVFQALSQIVNLKLCQWFFSNQAASQKDLVTYFKVPQSTIAYHLLRLREAGLVGFEKDEKDSRRQIPFLIKSEAVQTSRQLLERLRGAVFRDKKRSRPVDLNLERLLTTFGALSEINRLRLGDLLVEGRELVVEELIKGARLSQSLVSLHLKVLLDAGLVRLRQCPTNLSLHHYSLIDSVGLRRAMQFLGQISRRGRDPSKCQIVLAPSLKKSRPAGPSGSDKDSFEGSPSDSLPNPSVGQRDIYICYQGFCQDARADGRVMPTLKMHEFLTDLSRLDWRERQRWKEFYARGYPAVKDEMIRGGFLKPL